MKGTSKGTKVKSAQEEECGIWLDTTELKEKKQKVTLNVYYICIIKKNNYLTVFILFRNSLLVQSPNYSIHWRDQVDTVWL